MGTTSPAGPARGCPTPPPPPSRGGRAITDAIGPVSASQGQKHAPAGRWCPAERAESLRDGLRHVVNAAAVEGLRKRAAILGGSKSYREASNRVDRSHSVSTEWTCNEWSETP